MLESLGGGFGVFPQASSQLLCLFERFPGVFQPGFCLPRQLASGLGLLVRLCRPTDHGLHAFLWCAPFIF